jgi:hypothetical protein
MGVITGLLLLPITGPVRAFRWFLEELRDEAEAVLRDEGRAFAELIDLSRRHSAGQISDAEHAEQEAELIERLNAIREYRDALLSPEPEEDEELYFEPDEDELLYAEPEEGELWQPEPDEAEEVW